MRKIVRVTRKNIKQGRRCDPRFCPVARALKQTFSELDGVEVGGSFKFYRPYALNATYVTISKKVQRFINLFDDKKPVKPFSFSISL